MVEGRDCRVNAGHCHRISSYTEGRGNGCLVRGLNFHQGRDRSQQPIQPIRRRQQGR
jgi:hypothetical protein